MKERLFKYSLLIIFLYLNIINISLEEALVCGDNTINNCLECSSTDTCSSCEDYYFLTINGISCLPCNDPIYGQINCEGKCDGQLYASERNIRCEGKCKEGYYNLKGNCTKCDENFQGCAKCSYENEFFKCDECQKGYEKDETNGECKRCEMVSSPSEDCFRCKDNDYNICRCNKGFYNKKDSECDSCGNGCYDCILNGGTKECLYCYSEYILNSEKTCSDCGDRCEYCIFDQYSNSHCYYCGSTIYTNDQKCGTCSDGCSRCKENGENPTICTECYDNYALNQSKECVKCETIQSISGNKGCKSCIYIEDQDKYECLKCWNNDSVYIMNTFQCLSNINDSEPYYGCQYAEYDELNEKYKCLKCKYGFIPVDESRCEDPTKYGISENCLFLDKIDLITYSCLECQNNLAHILDVNLDIYTCYVREKELSFCLEGKKDINNNLICEKCVENTEKEGNICKCRQYSLGKNNQFCEKCDAIDEDKKQCFKCEYDIGNCNKCHFDEVDKKLKCDNCISVYALSEDKEKCEINECEHYLEISPGCMICKDKLKEYKDKDQCQYCKNGYFKTKEGKCEYCRSEKNGGPACYKCGYELDDQGRETDNVICKDCYSYFNYLKKYKFYSGSYIGNFHYFTSVLSPKGKCYNCRYDLSESCLKCGFDKNDKLICLLCSPGYYTTSDGECISFMDKIQKNKNCYKESFTIDGYSFYLYHDINKDIIEMNYDIGNLFYDYESYNKAMNNLHSVTSIHTTCLSCQEGYILNQDNKCVKPVIKDCIGDAIINNKNEIMSVCRDLCEQNKFPYIYLNFIKYKHYYMMSDFVNIPSDQTIEIEPRSILSALYNIKYANKDTSEFISQFNLCYDISENKAEFDGCNSVLYDTKEETYTCIECRDDFIMDLENNKCHQNLGNIIEKFNTDGKTCLSTLVTYENGDKACIYDETIYNCKEAKAHTEYINTVYDCTSCMVNFLPFYSKFYQRNICQHILEPIQTEKTFILEVFKEEDFENADENGNCEDKYFTPDGKKCYKCNNKNVGMPGCDGKCSFSDKRNNMLLCESNKCLNGYIESSKGICEICENINEGCQKCSYKEDYPNNYFGIKRKRRFFCESCMGDYIQTDEGWCISCSSLFNNCDKCEKDGTTGNYKCTQCSKHYYINQYGICEQCIVTNALINNKCIKCDSKDGIENCLFCQENEEGNGIVCKQCKEGYLLDIDSQNCLKREEESNQFDSCLEIITKDDKQVCTRCKPDFSLLKFNTESKCTYIPTLYDPNYLSYYLRYTYNITSDRFANFIKNDYFFRLTKYLPCKESTNIGENDENPIYSCNKCYNVFDNEEYDEYYFYDYYYIEQDDYLYYDGFYNIIYNALYRDDFFLYQDLFYNYYETMPVKINDENNKISYCFQTNEATENCVEANYKISKGKEIYSCTKCLNGFELLFNKESNIYYCSKSYNKCLVHFCKNCLPNNNYFCSNCITSEYKVNSISGSCVKKTEVEPVITWKDIYRLNMNGQMEINGQLRHGPCFLIRGITCSQINSKHAFLIVLTFIVNERLRNLEEKLEVPTICEINQNYEESKDNINIVDYECIGKTEVDGEKYKLVGVIGENIDENILNDPTKKSSYYTKKDIPTIFIIENNDLVNKTITNIPFYFSFNGILKGDKSINLPNKAEADLEVYGLNDTAKCNFLKDEKLNANMTCMLNINQSQELADFTFKNPEIKIGEQSLFLNNINKVYLLYDKANIIEKINIGGKKSKNHTLAIVLGVVIGVIVVGAAIGIMLYFLKKKKVNDINEDSNVKNMNEQNNSGNKDYNASTTNISN